MNAAVPSSPASPPSPYSSAIGKSNIESHTLSVLVDNEPGVLARVVGLFSGRGYNIDSLNVAPTHDPSLSRMSIVTRGDDATVEQIVKQLNKLIEVRKVLELGDSAVRREMVLVKVRADAATRSQVIDVVGLFRGKAVDVSAETITIEATGSDEKLQALLEMLSPHGIVELVQSGQVALGRGAKTLTEKSK